MENIVNLKNLRQNMGDYVKKIAQGQTFIVFKQSRPLFKISPIDEGRWDEVIDFTKIKKGGVNIDEVLSRL